MIFDFKLYHEDYGRYQQDHRILHEILFARSVGFLCRIKGVLRMSVNKANFLLVLVTVAWGASYLFTKTAVAEIAPFTLISYRFLLAFFITAVVFWKYIRKTNVQTLLASSLLGFIMAIVCILFGYALRITEASVAGFLIATTVIIVPMLMMVIYAQIAYTPSCNRWDCNNNRLSIIFVKWLNNH